MPEGSSTDTTVGYYRILGISPEATHEEMRAAYRTRLRLWHPDLVADATDDVRQAATEMTAQLNEAYECLTDLDRRIAHDTTRRTSTPRRKTTSSSSPHSTRRSDHRVRDMTTIGLGGIVLPLLVLAWVSGLSPVPAPPNPPLIAALCAGVIVATILTSSRLLRRPDRLARIGVVWIHLMRWSGWILIGGCAVFLGIPAIVLALMAIFAAPFFGLVLVAFISGRFDSQDR